jgi:single-strand DNA-binding protein
MHANHVFQIGRLVDNVEFAKAKDGDDRHDRAWGRIAVNRIGSEECDYFRFCCWGKVARATVQYTEKGKEIKLEGELRSSTYEAENGETRYAVEINASDVSFGESSLAVKNAKAAAKAAAAAPTAAVDPTTMAAVLAMMAQFQAQAAKPETAAASASDDNPFEIPG